MFYTNPCLVKMHHSARAVSMILLCSSRFRNCVIGSTLRSCFVYAYMTEMWYYSPVDAWSLEYCWDRRRARFPFVKGPGAVPDAGPLGLQGAMDTL